MVKRYISLVLVWIMLGAMPVSAMPEGISFSENQWDQTLRKDEIGLPEGKFPFDDVSEEDWFYPPVVDVKLLSFFSGTAQNLFSPYDSMTRGMFVTVLGKMARMDPGSYSGTAFADVPEDRYYAPYVNWAAENQFVAGTGDQKFSPEESVTREQACIILYRYAQKLDLNLEVIDEADPGFTDLGGLSEISKTSILSLFRAAVLMGKTPTTFDPTAQITRAEAAQMFVSSYYTFYDIQEKVMNPESFHPTYVTIPGYWHGKADYGRMYSSGGLFLNDHLIFVSPGAGKLFTIITVLDRIRDTGRYLDDDENLLPEYRILNRIRFFEQDYLVLLHTPAPEEPQVNPDNPVAVRTYHRLQKKMQQVIDSLEYGEGVEVLGADENTRPDGTKPVTPKPSQKPEGPELSRSPAESRKPEESVKPKGA